jgi:hypothetical protein
VLLLASHRCAPREASIVFAEAAGVLDQARKVQAALVHPTPNVPAWFLTGTFDATSARGYG